MAYQITALSGDGIGPELMASGLQVLNQIGERFEHRFTIQEKPFGGIAIEEQGNPLPAETATACQQADAILLGAIGGEQWQNSENTPEMGLLRLRKDLRLFANLRPITVPNSVAHLSPLKAEIVTGSDFVVVRELTGGLYFGEPKELREFDAVDTLHYTKKEIDRIVRYAFELAMTRRKKITSVDKANVLATSKLWRQTVEEIRTDFPEVTVEHLYVDAASMLLIQRPTEFDVLVTENLFGDILSDEASVLTGSLGMLPSASHSVSGPSLYEPIHGSAPDISGKNCANPMSMILSVALMLRQSFGLHEEANAIELAADQIMRNGYLTADLGGSTTTTDFTKQLCKKIREGGSD